jgi:DNA-binding CsgD family transcriptional regulator
LLTGTPQMEIAAPLGINAITVNTYRRRILEKFGVKNLNELIKIHARIKL